MSPTPPTEAQRTVAVTRLRESLARDELSLEEYTHRLDLVFEAETVDQLDEAFRWLPPASPAVSTDATLSPETRPMGLGGAIRLVAGVFVALAVLVTGWRVVSPTASTSPTSRGGPEAAAPADDSPIEAEGAPASGVSYRPNPSYSDLPDLLVFSYDGDATSPSGDERDLVSEYLDAISGRDFDLARSLLCSPLRAEFPTGADVEERLFDEHQPLFSGFTLLDERSAAGNLRFSLSGRNWGQGPLEIRLVPEQGAWRACGAGLEDARLGFLAFGALGY